MNLDTTANDQWSPVIAVKPDGNQLFVGWNDRRLDTSNSLIHVYGRFATITSSGTVHFAANDFRITTESFPPAFPGTLNTNQGTYDPVWAPQGVNLHWGFGWWPVPIPGFPEANLTSSDTYAHEAGEHNGVYADANHLYFVWSDNRVQSQGTDYPGRKQADVRLLRLSW